MLTNVKQLKKIVSNEQIAAKAKRAKAAQVLHEVTLQHNMRTAETFLHDILPPLIKRAEEKKCRRVVYPHEHGYAGELALSFFDPKTLHTEHVLATLESLGYVSEIKVTERGNVDYVSRGDDYDIVDAPGTHEIYQLVVSWS